jgi:histidinol-phosphate aminotransferase
MTTMAPIRLDRNEGARPDEALIASALDSRTDLFREYPDARPLEEALASRYFVDPDRVVVTNGADGALERACRVGLGPGAELLMTNPTFEMFPLFAAMTGASQVTVPWLGRFPRDEFIAGITPATGVIALVSPNNPTGQVLSLDDLAAVAAAAPSALVIFDHVYADYAAEDLTLAALEFPNVVVVRTFSKAWGLAGCRVGYAITRPAVAYRLREAGPPYSVAAPSLALALTAFQRGDAAVARHVARVLEEREDLRGRMIAWGVECPLSEGNFLFPVFGSRVESVFESLREDGILVRRFNNNPAIASSLRISLPGDPATYDRLLHGLARALGGAR